MEKLFSLPVESPSSWAALESAMSEFHGLIAESPLAIRSVMWLTLVREFTSFNGAVGAFEILHNHGDELIGIAAESGVSGNEAQGMFTSITAKLEYERDLTELLAELPTDRSADRWRVTFTAWILERSGPSEAPLHKPGKKSAASTVPGA